ncbi:DUF3987 domain-containing protein [Desulfobacterales bacterium HSG17]|nr:DUF3987 domain-containing protein [Desulfobacterales bacterium HSG17]
MATTFIVETAKGSHVYLKYQNGLRNSVRVKDRNGQPIDADVRTDGGYVVAPPSIHKTGKQYNWIGDNPTDMDDWRFELEPIPQGIVDLLMQKDHRTDSPGYDVDSIINGVQEGERDQKIFKLACSYRARNMHLSESLVLIQHAAAACTPPFPEDQARKKLKQAWKYEVGTGEDFNSKRDPEPLPDELLPVIPFDFALLPEKLQPWVQDICERVQCPPDYVAVGVIAILGSLIGRKVGIRPQAKTDWTVIPNQWTMIVGRPGLLKSPALEQALAPIKRLAAEAQDQYQDFEDLFEKEQLVAKLKKEAAEKEARKKLKNDSKADLLAVLAVDEPDVPVLKRYS